MTRVAQAGKALVGLGPGLTPSGDDFLGGLLFQLHHLSAVYPEVLRWERAPVDDLLTWAGTQTNPISSALLRDHIEGHGSEPLHALVAQLLRGDEPEIMRMSVQRLLRIGSTSGWDLLAGVLMGMLWITPDGVS
jgi:hypothetical protein